MIASRLGFEDIGIGGGALASGASEGRVWGTGGGSTVALLLKPRDRADRCGRCGGGMMTLSVCVVDVGRLISAGFSGERSGIFVAFLGGRDGLDGSAGICVSK